MNHFLSNFKSQWSTLQTKLSADKEELPASSANADQPQQQTEQISTESGEQQHDMGDKIRPSQIANRVFGIAKKASSKLQEKATNISAIVNERTIIGNIEKERQKFMEELRKEGKCVGDMGLDGLLADVEAQHHIIEISSNAGNLTEEPPLTFDLDSDIALVKQHAEALFRLDPRLAVLRFELVPKQVQEEKFWRNYAYRISLVRKFMSEKCSSLAGEQQQCSTTAEAEREDKHSAAKDEQPQNQQSVESTENEEEKLLEKELLGDLNEFEMVVDDEEGTKDNGSANGEDEKMGEDELLEKLMED